MDFLCKTVKTMKTLSNHEKPRMTLARTLNSIICSNLGIWGLWEGSLHKQAPLRNRMQNLHVFVHLSFGDAYGDA